jgi:hypothetical protein
MSGSTISLDAPMLTTLVSTQAPTGLSDGRGGVEEGGGGADGGEGDDDDDGYNPDKPQWDNHTHWSHKGGEGGGGKSEAGACWAAGWRIFNQ